MQDFEGFKKTITNKLLSEAKEYGFDSYEYETVDKPGYQYEGVIFYNAEKKSGVCNPVFNLTDGFAEYKKGTTMASMVARFVDYIKNNVPSIDTTALLNFDNVKNEILPRVVNVNLNKEYIERMVHRVIKGSDLAVIYYVPVAKGDNQISYATITQPMLKAWKINKTQLNQTALENLARGGYRLQSLANFYEASFFKSTPKLLKAKDLKKVRVEGDAFVITNDNNLFGAALVLNTDLLKEIREAIGAFYILPASVHEVIIMPKRRNDNLKELNELVKQTNEDHVALDEQLSNVVYEFDKSFKLAVA